MWASSQGRLDSIAVLLEAGADVNAVDIDGVSALMWACGSETSDENHKKGLLEKANKGHSDVVLLLLQYGALVDMTDNDGITAIMYASYHGHASAVEGEKANTWEITMALTIQSMVDSDRCVDCTWIKRHR